MHSGEVGHLLEVQRRQLSATARRTIFKDIWSQISTIQPHILVAHHSCRHRPMSPALASATGVTSHGERQ